MFFEVDEYKTDRGWVARVTRLDRFGQDELVYTAGLGAEDNTREGAHNRGVLWVQSQGGIPVKRLSGFPENARSSA
jgi:hypothetical protein